MATVLKYPGIGGMGIGLIRAGMWNVKFELGIANDVYVFGVLNVKETVFPSDKSE